MFGWFVAFLKSVCTCLGLVPFGSRNLRSWLSINFLYLYLSTLLLKNMSQNPPEHGLYLCFLIGSFHTFLAYLFSLD